MLLYCLVHGKVQYFLESRVWWRAKWAVVPLSRYRMCCAMWQRGGHGATVPQHYWDHPCLGASHLSGLTLLYCTVASWLPRELNTYWCMCVRENVPYLGLCLVGRHLKVALSPSNFFEGGSDGPIHHQAWSDQNSLWGEEQVLGAKMIVHVSWSTLPGSGSRCLEGFLSVWCLRNPTKRTDVHTLSEFPCSLCEATWLP